MKFKKYQHIERLQREDCEGILNGTVYCFPKIDGTNASLWLDNGEVQGGSRNRQLTLDNDNAGFYCKTSKDPKYRAYLEEHPNHILYGEWLVKHTIKTYRDDAWQHLYVFDVFEVDEENDTGRYLPYEEYSEYLDKFGIEYIPPIKVVENPQVEDINALLSHNHYLMQGDEIGEGIVVKNYDYHNKYGHVIWGKIVAEEFFGKKADLKKEKKNRQDGAEEYLAHEYITDALIKKEYAKVKLDFANAKRQELIGRTLQTVYDAFLEEELVNAVKKNKKCTINFQTMQRASNERVKEVLRDELF